jgi:hypothetical protein
MEFRKIDPRGGWDAAEIGARYRAGDEGRVGWTTQAGYG